MYKISDFVIPMRVIQSACRAKQQPFIDLPVRFSNDSPEILMQDGTIMAGHPSSLSQTFYNIIYAYFDNFQNINQVSLFDSDIQKSDVLVMTSGFLRSLSYSVNSFPESKPSSPVVNYLYRWAVIWTIMKDLICPAFQVPIKNCKVVSFCSPYIDTSIYVDDKYMKKNNIVSEKTPFIFCNADMEYGPCLNAALLLSAIEAHGLNPAEVISEIYYSELKNQLVGFADLAFVDSKKSNDFISLLLTMSGLHNFSEDLIGNSVKVAGGFDIIKYAQSWDQVYGNWWYLGLIERMLEPVRGSDWSTHQRLQPFLDALWSKIEKERKKRGRDGLNYESLLRIKDGEITPDQVKLIERNLASDRVW